MKALLKNWINKKQRQKENDIKELGYKSIMFAVAGDIEQAEACEDELERKHGVVL